MTRPRIVTESLGGSPLSVAMQRGSLAELGDIRPTDAAGWRQVVQGVRQRFASDAWLNALAPAFGETANLPQLVRAAHGGVLVTTGQQPGLFGGHMLALTKALSALAYANAIEQVTGVPCAAVFWAATDDADFIEASSVVIPGTGAPETLALTQAPPAGTPMALAPMNDLTPLLAALEASCGSSAAATMAIVRAAYHDGATVGDAFVALMRAILKPLGIAVMDASHPAVRAAARPLLERALVQAKEIDAEATAWTARLRGDGFSPQVEAVAGLSLVFANARNTKRRIPIADARSAITADYDLSPTVLLRPIVEAAILPTIAYAGGPGELAYFAQVLPMADALGAARPLPMPRWSATIIEPSIERILARYGVDREELRDFDPLLTRLARGRLPADVTGALAEVGEMIARTMAALATAVAQHGVDQRIVEGLKAQLALRAARGERRVLAAFKRRDDDLLRDLGSARASLYPGGIRQERALSFVPFIARYGTGLLGDMLDEARVHATAMVGSHATSAAAMPVATPR